MAVEKKVLTASFLKREEEEVKKIEEIIDTAVRKDFVPGKTLKIEVEFSSDRVRKEIVKRYREAGWKVIGLLSSVVLS